MFLGWKSLGDGQAQNIVTLPGPQVFPQLPGLIGSMRERWGGLQATQDDGGW